MATNDIYNNQAKYEAFKNNINHILQPPKAEDKRTKYYCKNPANLEYFKTLIRHFEAKDQSFVRRLRLIQDLKLATHFITKDLASVTREDIDGVMTYINQVMKPESVSDYKTHLKTIWKIILPEADNKGRPDETITPYVVRHLKAGVDKSRQEARQDKLTWPEFENILTYFADKPVIQLYLMLEFESLGRPQELLWRKLKDVELHDNYAVIHLSDHGKEGTGLLHCLDSYPYLVAWLNVHPFKNNPEAYLFVNEKGAQHNNIAINKHLRNACAKLGLNKKITCYSLKRNGVTMRRLQGESDMEIQHVARWTSTKQLKKYDLSDQSDTLKIQLIKRGLVKPGKEQEHLQPKTKTCVFCNTINKLTDVACTNCNRPLDRQKIAELEYTKEIKALNEFMALPQIQDLFKTVHQLQQKVKQMEEE